MNSRKKVFFVAASPASLTPTEWDKEYMTVKTILNQHNLRRKYDIEMVCGVTPEIFVDQLPDECWLIHFSGHGKEGGKIFLEDGENGAFIPRTKDLIEVLDAANGVKCLLFNSCYSDKIAYLAKNYVDYAIGISGTIDNSPAIDFVKYFYKSFAKYETVPMAYKNAMRQLSFLKKGALNTVFECRNSFIMDMVLQDKQAELQQVLDRNDPLNRDIETLKQEVAELSETQKGMLSGLLKNNPHPMAVSWFVDNYESLAGYVGNKILDGEDEDMREDFSYEVSYLFGLLKACMVMNDNLYSKVQIDMLKGEAFPNSLFERAFDEIPSQVPDVYRSGDFIPFLRDHIKHMKSLL
jgi:hypothetical protein